MYTLIPEVKLEMRVCFTTVIVQSLNNSQTLTEVISYCFDKYICNWFYFIFLVVLHL